MNLYRQIADSNFSGNSHQLLDKLHRISTEHHCEDKRKANRNSRYNNDCGKNFSTFPPLDLLGEVDRYRSNWSLMIVKDARSLIIILIINCYWRDPNGLIISQHIFTIAELFKGFLE